MNLTTTSLAELERHAAKQDLLLRLQVQRPLNLWSLRLVVAEKISEERIRILGEMKAWAYKGENGLQLDTMRVSPNSKTGIGDLIWAATMAWAIEQTPCRKARLLAIRDEENHHTKLVRYFRQRGFSKTRQVGSSPSDLPIRMVWGGAGTLMTGECKLVYERSLRRLLNSGESIIAI
ncbi:hypothetical protein [Prochlorococcus sp. MIT 1341]|uniref:hypothetical protein n=1 Tax=Prochlorococcus sp. MIT 1341 TaxID=3096221 RepID=UPI002A761516|nr:hypothetical protein [Prochlorococcus sp. MIT 1341]